MNFKNVVFVISFLAVCGFLFNFGTSTAKAATMEELQVQIQALLQQIVQLQQQLVQVQGTTTTAWCHDFNTNLKIGDSGTEVTALHQALEKMGFGPFDRGDGESNAFDDFTEQTASEVVGFQQKYKDEVLTPWGLKYGTGFVGKSTRAKLNALYGCEAIIPTLPETPASTTPATTTSSITITSPNGREKWVAANTYNITWETKGFDNNAALILSLVNDGLDKVCRLVDGYVKAGEGKYSWKIGTDDCSSYYGDKLKIRLGESEGMSQPYIKDDSDNYFSIVSAATSTCHATSLWSWDYCSSACKCNAGEGDCDGNLECNTGYCALDVGTKYGQVSTMDVCEEKTTAEKSITLLSPNGGEKWQTGTTQIIKWNSANVSQIYIKLRKGSDTYPGTGGVVSNIIPNNGLYQWNIPSTLPDGSDYAIRVIDSGGSVLDDSDNYFSIVSTSTTACSDSDNGKDYYLQGTITDSGKSYTDYCTGSALKEYFCLPISDLGLGGAAQEDYICPSGCLNGACIAQKGSLILSLFSDTPISQSIIKGSTDVTFLKAKIIASVTEDIKVTSIRVYAYKNGLTTPAHPGEITNLKLYANGTQIGSTQSTVSGAIAEFTNLNWTILKGSSALLTVKADIPATTPVSGLQLAIAGGTDLAAAGVSSLASITTQGSAIGRVMAVISAVTTGCTDSDGGINYLIKGWTRDYYDTQSFYDYCTLDGKEITSCTSVGLNCGIIEKYCDANNRRSGSYLSGSSFDAKCPYGCQDGACKKGISVLSPNGGEKWTVGNAYEITWSSVGVDKINIELSSGSTGWHLTYNLPASLGKFSWKIGSANEGSSYKIHIWDANDPGISDTSDNYFAIAYGRISNLTCEDVNSVKYSGYLSHGGGIWPGFNWGYSYGTLYANSGWLDGNIKNPEKYPLEIHYLGNLYYGIEYGAGVLTFDCDGTTKEAWLPNVSVSAGGSASALYVADDGSTYYDKGLTSPARKAGEAATMKCYDSDSGKDYYAKGTANGIFGGINTEPLIQNPFYLELTDVCDTANNTYISEYYCDGGYVRYEYYKCPSGCQDGACILATTTPSITVISPNGGEKWTFGTPQTIKWQSTGVNNVVIELLIPNVSCYLSGTDVPAASGEYIVTLQENQKCLNIPTNIPAGQYKISIRSMDSSSSWTSQYGVIYDTSDNYFSIVAATAACTDSDGGKDYYVKGTTKGLDGKGVITTDTDSCSVCGTEANNSSCVVEWFCSGAYRTNTNYACPNGCKDGVCLPASYITSFDYTETDAYGGSVKFSWTSSGADGVELQMSCHSGLTITDAVTGANFLCGDIDRSLSPNSSAYLKFANTSDPPISVTATLTPVINHIGYGAYSKTLNFTVVSTVPSITVLSPNGGEIWIAGDTYDIEWTSNGIDPNLPVGITLIDDAQNKIYEIESYLNKIGDGKLSWTYIPAHTAYTDSSSLFTGDKFKIRVYVATKDITVQYPDESDDYFSIVSSATTTSFKNMENQLADISRVVSQLMEQMKILGR